MCVEAVDQGPPLRDVRVRDWKWRAVGAVWWAPCVCFCVKPTCRLSTVSGALQAVTWDLMTWHLDGPSEHTIKSAGPAPATLEFPVVRPPHNPQAPLRGPNRALSPVSDPCFESARDRAQGDTRSLASVCTSDTMERRPAVATTTIWRRRPRGALGASRRPRCVSFLWLRGYRAVLRILRAREAERSLRRSRSIARH